MPTLDLKLFLLQTLSRADIVKSGSIEGIIDKIRQTVSHDKPVYVSLDIDLLDPAFAPGTSDCAAGGWTTREVIKIVIDALLYNDS